VSRGNREVPQSAWLDQVAHGSKIYTDEARVYKALLAEYTHEFANQLRYVDGRVDITGRRTSLFKQGLNRTYVAVEPFHLFRYLDEQMFRYNRALKVSCPMLSFETI